MDEGNRSLTHERRESRGMDRGLHLSGLATSPENTLSHAIIQPFGI